MGLPAKATEQAKTSGYIAPAQMQTYGALHNAVRILTFSIHSQVAIRTDYTQCTNDASKKERKSTPVTTSCKHRTASVHAHAKDTCTFAAAFDNVIFRRAPQPNKPIVGFTHAKAKA